MSAIFGIFYKDNRPVLPETLAPIERTCRTWEIDGRGLWYEQSIGLGHLMLHTTPESINEQLPAIHEDRWVITADARIDNREELFAALHVPSERRRTMADSTLILLAYERWGQACISKLIGAFAFAIWDRRERTLFCGRDHIGLKPFYYFDDGRRFIFASTIEGMLACVEVPQRLNEPLVAAHLQESTYFAEKRQTFWADIVKLPPAHACFVSGRRIQLTHYWTLETIPPIRLSSDEAYAERMRELLIEAVRSRIRTPFSVGAHLSGGLDSSSVTSVAAKLQNEQGKTLTAYSWSPPPSPHLSPTDTTGGDERSLVQAVCDRYQLQCNYLNLTVDDIVRNCQRNFMRVPNEMMWREELTQQQAVRDNVRIMLSGWGGDEVATGHGWGYWSELFLRGRWRKLHSEMVMRGRHGQVSRIRQLKRYAHMGFTKVLLPLFPNPIWTQWRGWTMRHPVSCVNKEFAAQHRADVIAMRGPSLREQPNVHLMQWHWLDNGHVTSRLESWAAHGVTKKIVYDYPLLDRRILEFCMGCPPDQIVQNGWKRSLMRRAVEGLIPEAIQWQWLKSEPAAIGALDVMVRALPVLHKKLQADIIDADRFVDTDKLAKVIPTLTDMAREVEILLITMACARASSASD